MSPTVPPISTMATSTPSAHSQDARLDLVGDVRNDLHGPAQVLAAPLLLDDRQVDLAGGDVVEPRHPLREEALVVAEVEVGLGAVVGDEHLAVLLRVHRARIDVEVRVELLDGDLEPRASSSEPIDAAASPLPSDETTPPVTKMNFVRLVGVLVWALRLVSSRRQIRERLRAGDEPPRRSPSDNVDGALARVRNRRQPARVRRSANRRLPQLGASFWACDPSKSMLKSGRAVDDALLPKNPSLSRCSLTPSSADR